MAIAHHACDRAIAHGADAWAAGEPTGEARTVDERMVLATCILASSLAFVDGSSTNVALPAIGADLAVEEGLSWVVNGYLLPLSALLLIGGAAGDLYGRRRLLVWGTTLFALASIACAFAPSLSWLVAGRIAQGLGAAMLMPNSLAILGSVFRGEARGRAVGTWAAVGAAAGAVAPLVGGWLVDVAGWPAIFWTNLPIAAAAIWCALRYVPEDRDADRPPLDVAGALLVSGGLAALTWGLTVAAETQLTPMAGGALVAGALALAAYLWLARAKGERSMTPLDMFSSRAFLGLTALTFLLYGALGALLVLVPYVLIEAEGYSALAAGAALLPLPLVIALASSRMGALAARTGARLPLSLGPLVVAAGCALLALIGSGGTYWTDVLPGMLLVALGMAAAVAPLTTAVLSAVDDDHQGVASGLNSAVARTGGLIATAIAAFVFASEGEALLDAFRLAAWAATGTALAAGAIIWIAGESLGVEETNAA